MIPKYFRRKFVPGEATILRVNGISLHTITAGGDAVDFNPTITKGGDVLAMVSVYLIGRIWAIVAVDGEYWATVNYDGCFFIQTDIGLTEGDREVIADAVGRYISEELKI